MICYNLSLRMSAPIPAICISLFYQEKDAICTHNGIEESNISFLAK